MDFCLFLISKYEGKGIKKKQSAKKKIKTENKYDHMFIITIVTYSLFF